MISAAMKRVGVTKFWKSVVDVVVLRQDDGQYDAFQFLVLILRGMHDGLEDCDADDAEYDAPGDTKTLEGHGLRLLTEKLGTPVCRLVRRLRRRLGNQHRRQECRLGCLGPHSDSYQSMMNSCYVDKRMSRWASP